MSTSTTPSPHEGSSRARARERLARELHDELAHRVSSISLQVMGHRGSEDAAQLRRAMDTIAATAGDILAQLWMLDRVLRAHPFDASAASLGVGAGLPHLAVCEPVAALVERQARALRHGGFDVDIRTVDPAEDVGALARRTLEDAVLVSGQIIDRRAATGARCTIELELTPGAVSLRIAATLPETGAPSLDEDAPELVALHERVRLTEGTFWIGDQDRPEGRVWSMSLRLRDR